MAVRRSPRRRRSGGNIIGHRRSSGGQSNVLWSVMLVGLLAFIGLGGAWVYRTLGSRGHLDEKTLCPTDGPAGLTVILLDLTDPLTEVQASRLRGLLTEEIERAPVATMVSIGVVSELPQNWGPRFALCKPATGADASIIYENPDLIAKRFETGFLDVFNKSLDEMMQATTEKHSPIMEALQALISGTSGSVGREMPKRIILVSDLIQNSQTLSFYRGEDWDSFEKSGAVERLARNLEGARIMILQIPRPGAGPSVIAKVDPFWSNYLDRQGAKPPFDIVSLGDL